MELRFAAQRVGAPFSPREICRKDDRLPHQTSGYPARIRRPQQQGIRMFESAAVHPSLPVTVELKETPIRNATTDERKKKGPLESSKNNHAPLLWS